MPALPKEVQYGQDLDIENAPVLSEEERYILKKRQEALDQVLVAQQKAKYKIEMMFGSSYRSGQAFPGALSLWLSGSRLHGGGDEICFMCPACSEQHHDKVLPLAAVIPPSSQGYGHGVCGHCGSTWKGEQLHGEILARLTRQNWVLLIERWLRTVDGNADLYMKRPRLDLRRAADAEQAKQLGGDKLRAVRQKIEVVIYPFRNLCADVSAGATRESRIRAFLDA